MAEIKALDLSFQEKTCANQTGHFCVFPLIDIFEDTCAL